jgi:hypothetical protein
MHHGHVAGFVNLIQRVLAGSLTGVFSVAFDFRRPVVKIRGRTASAPYTRKNGLNPVALLEVVLRLQMTDGNS